jgi:hypothetical protein
MIKKGLLQPLVLAALLAAGFLVVWFLAGEWAVAIGEHFAGADEVTESLFFLPDGTPRVVRVAGDADRQYRDLDGNPAPPPQDGAAQLGGWALPAALPPAGGDVSWDERVRAFTDGRAPATFWYFVCDGRADGTGYFVGYDSASRACVGYLGAAGFRDAPLPSEELIPFGGQASGRGAGVFCTQQVPRQAGVPLPGSAGQAPHGSVSTWDVYVLGRDARLYHADLQERTLHVAVDGPAVRSAALASGVPDPVRGTPFRPAVRTDDAVLVCNERGAVLSCYPVPEALRGRDLCFTETSTGEAVLCWNSPFDELAREVEYRIWWVAPDGRSREARTTLAWCGGLQPLQTWGGLVVPSPAVLGGYVGLRRSRQLLDERLAASYPAALGRALAEFGPALVTAQLLAAGLAVLCYRRQVRYGAGRAERVLWPLFVLVLGLPGWVGYRFGRSWPVLEACPACAGTVPRDREACKRCAAEFPPPALVGTEVFA